ncbi:zf-TFIIB domain-containing protein [Dongia sp.]|uniref:TFIIB-type zinc ribbon-containing protein n=1 Tax=Dongia sp. TaxID=1977262 RepID=UPI003753CA51
MLCPVCKVDLIMTERQNVEIDYCPKCRGIWLDRGELDKIIERSAASNPAQVMSELAGPTGIEQKHGSSSHGKHGKRRKSWLEEIFD